MNEFQLLNDVASLRNSLDESRFGKLVKRIYFEKLRSKIPFLLINIVLVLSVVLFIFFVIAYQFDKPEFLFIVFLIYEFLMLWWFSIRFQRIMKSIKEKDFGEKNPIFQMTIFGRNHQALRLHICYNSLLASNRTLLESESRFENAKQLIIGHASIRNYNLFSINPLLATAIALIIAIYSGFSSIEAFWKSPIFVTLTISPILLIFYVYAISPEFFSGQEARVREELFFLEFLSVLVKFNANKGSHE